MKPQRLTLDLKKNPEVADLVADLEPADKIDACFRIVSKDDQSVIVELVSVDEYSGKDDDDDDDDEEYDKKKKTKTDESPAVKVASGMNFGSDDDE